MRPLNNNIPYYKAFIFMIHFENKYSILQTDKKLR